MTQGFIENNTKPDGAYDFFNGVAGPKRAWFGMWDHVRGNDVDADGRLAMGRHGWFDEVMRFYDQHLLGVAPSVQDPPVAVETSDGTWRSEAQWPPADASALSTPLRPGAYTDDAQNNGTADGGTPNGQGIWTFSPPLAHDAHFAGVPKVTVDASIALPDANLVADVYDVDSGGQATLISRGTYLLAGSGQVSFDLYGDDWKLPAGHRVGVLLTSSNSEWWLHRPTLQPVTVQLARRSRCPGARARAARRSRAAPRSSSTPTRPPRRSRCPRRPSPPAPTRRSRCPERWARAADVVLTASTPAGATGPAPAGTSSASSACASRRFAARHRGESPGVCGLSEACVVKSAYPTMWRRATSSCTGASIRCRRAVARLPNLLASRMSRGAAASART